MIHKISFIIVNFNGMAFIRFCLDSLLKQTYTNFEIIVVDNGSSDQSVDIVKKEYPQVALVELSHNTGFTGGNNAGFEASCGDYIALINNDVKLDPNWAFHMVKGIESSPTTGLCSSKIIISGTRLIDSIGDQFTTAFSGTKVGELQNESLFNIPVNFHGACAAAALYKRSLINDIGLFNDMFFLNHEDTDLNMRAWLAGYHCRYVPEAIAYHDVNRTIGEYSDISVYYFSRNSVWVWLINVPTYFMIKHFPQRIMYEISAALFYCVIKKRFKPFIRGKIDAFKAIGKVLQIRKDIQKRVRISHGQITQDLIPIMSYIKNRL